jgi:hypothetical protein
MLRTSAVEGIVLQKSQKALRLIFCQGTKPATIADQCSLRPVTGIGRDPQIYVVMNISNGRDALRGLAT